MNESIFIEPYKISNINGIWYVSNGLQKVGESRELSGALQIAAENAYGTSQIASRPDIIEKYEKAHKKLAFMHGCEERKQYPQGR